MTPEEVYALPVKEETFDLNYLIGCYFNHVPEIESDTVYILADDVNKSVKIKVHNETNSDGRRFWRLASVWFNDQPFMVIQNAGREGDDHFKRWITDMIQYTSVIQYIQNLPRKDISIRPSHDVVNPTEDLGNLYYFYGHDVRQHYDFY